MPILQMMELDRLADFERQPLGELLITKGLITRSELDEALAAQMAAQDHIPLGEILIKQKRLTAHQLAGVFKAHGGRSKLGEVLVRASAITREQLDLALSLQSTYKLPLGQLLVRLGHITDDAMRQALARQLNVPFVELDRYSLDPALARTVNRSYARRHVLVPISCVGNSLTVCMDNPTDEAAIEELRRSTGRTINVVTASHHEIESAFARLYAHGVETSTATVNAKVEILAEESARTAGATYGSEYRQLRNADGIVQKLLSLAIERRSSDIHLEMLSNRLSIRFRIDGVLEDPHLGNLQDACNAHAREIVSRLKILASMDIAERRRPQDGSFRVRFERNGEEAKVDLRISVVPSVYGESVVLRVLDTAQQPTSVEALGFPAEAAQRFRDLLTRPSGILLVTGPTGSGKSTTLYAALKALYRPQIRILTIEDPVEHIYEQFSQSEVNEQIGNTFARYLRAFLRHDPEVIMVGEIRDQETAEVAFRAAQTGHLLLSTLHTNTSVAAITRLRDLGIDANLIASSLIGVLGQRLVRQVCEDCKVQYQPSREVLRQFFDTGAAPFALWKGRGCERCNFTGYHGRQAAVELWIPTDEDAILITAEAPFPDIQSSAARSTISMASCAWGLIGQGRTTLEELIRMLPHSAIAEMRDLQAAPRKRGDRPLPFSPGGDIDRRRALSNDIEAPMLQ